MQSLLITQGSVIGDGEAMHFILDLRQKIARFLHLSQTIFAVHVDDAAGAMIIILHKPHDRNLDIQFPEHFKGDVHLSFSPIHDDEIREDREFSTGVIQLSFLDFSDFTEPSLESPGENLSHGVIIIGSCHGSDLESPVVASFESVLFVDHHGPHGIHALNVGNIKGLDSFRQIVQFEGRCQLTECQAAGFILTEDLLLELIDGGFGIAFCQSQHVEFVSPLRGVKRNALSPSHGEPVHKDLVIHFRSAVDGLRYKGGTAVVAFDEIRQNLLLFFLGEAFEYVVFSSCEFSVSNIEDLNRHILLILMDADVVLIIQSSCEHLLFLQGLVDGEELVSQVRRPFKIQRFGCFQHLLLQRLSDLHIPSFQKVYDVFNHEAIFRFGDIPCTGRLAESQMIIEAGLCRLSEFQYDSSTGSDGIDLLDGVQGLMDRIHVRIGTEISVSVPGIGSRHIDSREVLIGGDLDERKMLVILQQHIVSGTVLLDEIHLKNQRFHFAVRDDVLEFRHLADHDSGLLRVVLRILEVGLHSFFQILGFTHIDNFTQAVFHQIYTRVIREYTELIF